MNDAEVEGFFQNMLPSKTSKNAKQAQDASKESEEREKNSVFGQHGSMARSGIKGGTPMVSRPGKMTIEQYLCFSNGVKQRGGPDLQAAIQAKRDEETRQRLTLELTLVQLDSQRAQQIKMEIEDLNARPLAALI